MSSLLLIACFAVSDVRVGTPEVQEMVDVIELHHCHDFRGREAFRQLIFYRWSSYHRRFQIVDTVVVTDDKMCPQKTLSGLYRCRWRDDQQIRVVQSLTFRQTRSTTDPEVKERDFLPSHLRVGLKQTRLRREDNDSPAAQTSMLPPRPQKLLKF